MVEKIEVLDVDQDISEYTAMLNAQPTPRDKVRKLRSFPLPIHVKIALLKAYDAEDSTTCREQWQESYNHCKAECSESYTSIELWSHHLVVIEGMFGAGVGSFFSLLRSLFLLNAILFLVFMIFLILPQCLNSSSAAKAKMMATMLKADSLAHTCSKIYEDKLHNESLSTSVFSKTLDVLSGTGWMEKTILFFGAYFPLELSVTTTSYNYPLAYLIVLGVSFLASIILLLHFASQCFRDAAVSEKSTAGSRYCNIVFGGWDYSLINEKNARLKTYMIYNEVMANIHSDDYYEEMRTMSKGQKCSLYLIRALINILILGMLVGAGYLVYFVQQESSRYTVSNSDPGSFFRLIMEFLPSLTIAAIGAVLPIVFRLVVQFEKYSSETEIVLTLIRIILFKLVAIAFLVIAIYSVITCTPKDDCRVATGSSCKAIICWETYVGQQFYKLVIAQFLVFLAVTFGVKGFRTLIVKKCHCKLSEIIGLPEFDIPICVFDLIYVQIITWFGTLFSPMLPGVTALILFILFYLELFACHMCYKPSEIPFKPSRSNLFFLLVLVFAFFLCISPIGYCVVKIPTSKGCGPFRVFNHMYDIIPATINSWPSWARSLFGWVGSAAFVVMMLGFMVMLVFYFATLAHTRLVISHHLQDQVNAESRNKQVLYRQLVAAGITPAVKDRHT